MRLVHALAALALVACLPGAAAAPERPECADESLAALLLECEAEIAAAPTATDRARIRKECLARVDAWELCQ